MSKKVIEKWLSDASETAGALNHNTHMNLISKRVSLQGVHGFDNIDYDAWSTQCLHEFSNRLIASVRYEGLKLIAESDKRIMFKTWEVVEGSDGTINAQGVEMLLELEEDDTWRLVQERVLPDDESAHDGLNVPGWMRGDLRGRTRSRI